MPGTGTWTCRAQGPRSARGAPRCAKGAPRCAGGGDPGVMGEHPDALERPSSARGAPGSAGGTLSCAGGAPGSARGCARGYPDLPGPRRAGGTPSHVRGAPRSAGMAPSRAGGARRIQDDAGQQPVVVAPVPDLVELPRGDGSPLLVLPQRVQLYRAGGAGGSISGNRVPPPQAVGARVCPPRSPLTREAAVGDVEHEPRLLGPVVPPAVGASLQLRLLLGLHLLCRRRGDTRGDMRGDTWGGQ